MANQKQLNQMLRQVQQMQAEMEAAQAALDDESVDGSAGGGVVVATVSGSGELRSIAIAPEVVDPDDVEMLQDLVVAAINEAMRAARALQQERLGSVTSGVDLGGLGGLLG